MMSPKFFSFGRSRNRRRRSGHSSAARGRRQILRLERLEQRCLLAGDLLHSISGIAFEDINGNGTQETGEPGLAGVTVNLYRDNGNGTFGTGDTLQASTTSAALGGYQFSNLATASYFIVQPAQSVGNLALTELVRGPFQMALVAGANVDSFDITAQSVMASNTAGGVNPATSATAATEAMGGERDLFAQLTSATGRIEISVNDTTPDIVEFGALGTSTGTRVITWDGPDGNASSLAPTGLGGIDLTANGQSRAFQLAIGADQSNGQAIIRVYSSSSRFSEATIAVPYTGGGAGNQVLVAFPDDFTPTGPQGGADFSNVGAIEFAVTGVAAIDVQLDSISLVGPTQQVVNLAEFVVRAGIQLEKATNGQDADTAPGPTVVAGSAVTWTYVVTNSGNVPLGSISVSDDRGVTVVFSGGDTNGDSLLDVTETWTYRATGTATAGQYANVGSVQGNPVDEQGNDLPGIPNVTDTDPSHYFGASPAIHLEKSTNGQDADTETGPLLAVGSPVTWTYVVTNTGTTVLGNVTVTDNRGVAVSFQGGDTDGDNRLDLAETWTYRATGTATAGQYTNMGRVTAVAVEANGQPIQGASAVSDDDPSNYFGVLAAVNLEKSTNGQDADTAPGPAIFVGQTATFSYVVTNTGNVPLANVTVRDDNGTSAMTADDFTPALVGGDTNSNGLLDLAERWTYTATRVVTEGVYRNEGVVTARDPLQAVVNDTDPSHHQGLVIYSKRRFLASSSRNSG